VRLLGSGRSADVYEHDPGEVLRRYRTPRDTGREVAAMEHARVHGYPVPAARALSDTDIVMERLEGPTMLADLARRPWRIDRHAATLADLHRRLHAIPAPHWLPAPVGAGDSLLHLDLHPDNVMLTPSGPFVIDWPNAARGPAYADVAHTWIVLACSVPTGGRWERWLSAAGRKAFLSRFLKRFERREAEARLGAAGAYRLASRTLPQSELEAIRRVALPLDASPRASAGGPAEPSA
jgi:aminoglycoside phosphotransferase (APT) family kinase protein